MTSDDLDLSAPASPATPGAATTPPPGGEPSLVLTAPEPVPVLEPARAGVMMPLPPDRVAEISEKARSFVASIRDADPLSPAFQDTVRTVETMGRREILASAQSSNRMLNRPLAALAAAKGEGADAQKSVADGLVQLRMTVEDLDPSAVRDTFTRAVLSLVPFRDRFRSYFGRYRAAQSHLDAIIRSLQHGQDELRKDNAAIEGEKVRLWEAMGKLQEYAVLAQALDAELTTHVDAVRAVEPQRADALTADLLFVVRQKQQDLLTQLAVSAQGYLALDVIRRNNLELVKGVDRATTTTVAALRTAVIAAQALADQRLVLDQIDQLNSTTSSLIVSTSEMLRTQSGRVAEQAASPAVSMEALQTAFSNIYQTLDTIDSYRVQAVETMGTTVDNLRTQLESASAYLERARERDASHGELP